MSFALRYLLDTCVISDFIKGEKGTLQRMKKTAPSQIAVTTITVMEIYYGLSINPARATLIKSLIQDFLNPITLISFNAEDGKKAAQARALLKQQGQPIEPYDILIAGTALNRQLTLVSANTKEFQRIKGLPLDNWRD